MALYNFEALAQGGGLQAEGKDNGGYARWWGGFIGGGLAVVVVGGVYRWCWGFIGEGRYGGVRGMCGGGFGGGGGVIDGGEMGGYRLGMGYR